MEFFEGVGDVVIFEDSVLCDFLDIVITLFYLCKYEVVFVSDLRELSHQLLLGRILFRVRNRSPGRRGRGRSFPGLLVRCGGVQGTLLPRSRTLLTRLLGPPLPGIRPLPVLRRFQSVHYWGKRKPTNNLPAQVNPVFNRPVIQLNLSVSSSSFSLIIVNSII